MDCIKEYARKCSGEKYVHGYANAMAPVSQRQMPLYSQVGKGLRGDSATIDLQTDNDDVVMVGRYFNQMTGETETLWELPVLNMVPKIHYEVWQGVRNIDGEWFLGYYVKYTCDITIGSEVHTFWAFDTPFAVTCPYHGNTVPDDYMIDSDQGD